MMDQVTMRVLRAFMVSGARVAPGEIVTVSQALAADLLAGGKAERASAPSVQPQASAVEQPEPKRRGRPGKE